MYKSRKFGNETVQGEGPLDWSLYKPVKCNVCCTKYNSKAGWDHCPHCGWSDDSMCCRLMRKLGFYDIYEEGLA